MRDVEFSSRPMKMRELLYRQRWEQYGDWEALMMLFEARSNLSISDMLDMTQDDLIHLSQLFDDSMQVAQSIQSLNKTWDRPRVRRVERSTPFEQLIENLIKSSK